MEDNEKAIKVISICLLIGLGIIFLAAIMNAIFAKSKIEITNIDQVDLGLSADDLSNFENYLYEGLERNENLPEDTNGIKVLIRPGSVVKSSKNGTNGYSFLMDIDEYKLTLATSFSLLSGQSFYESPTFTCATSSETKFPDNYCTFDGTTTLSADIQSFLPKYLELNSGDQVSIQRHSDGSTKDYLDVTISNCGSTSEESEAKNKLNAWISGLGFDSSRYDIKYTETCDGEL